MNEAVLVAAALIGFAIAAGPALVVTLLDMGQERAAKKAQTAPALVTSTHTDVREPEATLA